MKAAGNSCKQELLDLVMEILSILFLGIRVRIFIGVLPPSSVGIIPVRNSHLSCNGYICLWLLFISFLGGWGRGHSLTKSSKHSSADHAIYTQLSALAVTNKICHFTKTFMTRKAMELSSSFFFFFIAYEKPKQVIYNPDSWDLFTQQN